MIVRLTKIYLLAFALIAFYPCTSYSQSIIPGLDLIQEGEKNIEIPFQYIANFILIKVELQGFPLTFVFDTGANHTIIFEKKLTDYLGVNYEKPIMLKGSDISAEVVAYIARKVNLKTLNNNPVKRDILILEDNFLNLTEMTGIRIDGIIGGSFFRNLIVEIDHKKNKLVLWHPERFDKKLKNYTKAPLEIIGNKPYLICKTTKPNNEEYELKLLLDSGAALSYLINTNEKNIMTPPKNAAPGNLGKGIGGFISGYKGQMKSLTVGEYEFNNILTHFQELDENLDPETYNNREGLIGNILLERFNIIIDYMNKKIYLKPIKNLKKEFRYNLSGMELISFGHKLQDFVVFEVIKGSPAEEAGMQEGDIIQKIGFSPASRYTLYNIESMFSKKPGKTIKLKILREEEVLEKRIVLKDYLAN